MINVDNKIRNIYYMLCYSFNKDTLSEKDIASVNSETFDNIYNLFALILCIMIRKQVKKGMNKNYISETEQLSTVRGKIVLSETIQTNSLRNHKIVCNFDEFNENNILNQIIKTTAMYLITSKKIGNATKRELKKEMIFFNKVDRIEQISSINWKSLIYNRNNVSYKSIIVLCELILKGLIASSEKGDKQYKEFLDETALHRIYENFIREYYKKKGLPASKRKFKLTDNDNEIVGFAETDITLENEENMLIIDAKFYDHILTEGRYEGSKIISRDNINQVLAYVLKQHFETGKNVKGMLLYAQTLDEPEKYNSAIIAGYEIKIRTLDMNQDWQHICETLDEISYNFLNGNI